MENKDRLNQNQVAEEDNKWMEKRNRDSARQEESAKTHGDKNLEPTGNKDSNESANFAAGEGKNQQRNYSGNETSEYPSALQNSWDDNGTNPKGYGETDYDDKEIRRKQDEGQQPWGESDKNDEDV